MKFAFIFVCAGLFLLLQATTVLAGSAQEMRTEADQFYQNRDFKKAYKNYLKLAKIGDHYSQYRLAEIYAAGEGVKVDLTEAYAWSTLAAESGVEDIVDKSHELLQQTSDQAKAEKSAAKLQKKYGKLALEEKADKKARFEANHKMGGCTGSKLGCSKG